MRSANILTRLRPSPRVTADFTRNFSALSLAPVPSSRFRKYPGIALAFLSLVVPVKSSVRSLTHTKKHKKPQPVACREGCRPDTSAPQLPSSTPEDASLQTELASLAHALHTAQPRAYENLSAFANKNSANVWGARAALALGYEDYAKNRNLQALAWLKKAEADTLLRQYALFGSAQANHAAKRPSQAFLDLETLQRDYPNIAFKEQFLEAFGPVAIEAGHPLDAIEALNGYAATSSKPPLLLERAHAYQAAHQLARAVKDYQLLFYKSPLSDEAKAASSALPGIMHALGKEYPYPGVEMQQARAQAFFDARKWREARNEFEKLLAMLRDPENPARQHAQLRIAQCRVQLKGSSRLIASLKISSPEVDAERLYALSQALRSEKKESEMLAVINELAQKYPESKWSDDGLMAAGNYYWVNLDRDRAAAWYQRVLDSFPAGRNAYNADWRVTWVAYLNRKPDTDDRMRAFLMKYPTSSNAVDALYWMGRDAERAGNPDHARSFYEKAVDRFPCTYFGHAAAERLSKLGPGPKNPAEFLSRIPPAPALRPFDEPIPESAADRWERAQALRMLGMDSSAELELKAGYFATASPRFLLEAAQAAFDQGHFAAGMAYARTIVPNSEARQLEDVPRNVWKALYPLPYEAALRREAARNNFDPMLAAGLIRQESTFQADAVSHANAIGLMQVLPKTGRLLARQLRVRYAKTKLMDPDYNLELGMLYISGLLRATGEPEYALAAFNAGEDRIAAWRAERRYDEVAELVESIPFSETREYVQVVLRNAEAYRLIYGAGNPPGSAPVSQGRLAAAPASSPSAR